MVGNFGSFFSPIITGYLIGRFHNYGVIFTFMGIVSAVGLLLTVFILDEPISPA